MFRAEQERDKKPVIIKKKSKARERECNTKQQNEQKSINLSYELEPINVTSLFYICNTCLYLSYLSFLLWIRFCV